MKSALTVCLFFVFCNQLIAQDEIYFRDLEDEPFKRSVEISGITKSNDTIFLPSEKCKLIYMLNSRDLSNIGSIELGEQKILQNRPKVEIEAITKYQNYLIMTDEYSDDDKRLPSIYAYDLIKKTLTKAIVNGPNGEDDYLRDFTNNNGIEGIAINRKYQLIYAMKEKDANKKYAEIHTFRFTIKNGTFTLTYNSVNKYELPIQGKSRFSDICVDEDSQTLYCLVPIYYGRDNKNNDYFLRKTGLVKGIPQETYKDLVSPALGNQIKNIKCSYDSNLEGLYVEGNHVWIVSDNKAKWHEKINDIVEYCDESANLKTAFIEIKLDSKDAIKSILVEQDDGYNEDPFHR